MSKSVLISIRPEWCEMIANGEKTIEVRKSKPKLETPFKCYIYETRGRTDIPWQDEDGHLDFHGRGQIIGEFVCDRITNLFAESRFWIDEKIVEKTCLTGNQIREYANGKESIYGWHISDLKIYDKPRDAGEFLFKCSGDCDACKHSVLDPFESFDEPRYNCKCAYHIPQSWCYTKGYLK